MMKNLWVVLSILIGVECGASDGGWSVHSGSTTSSEKTSQSSKENVKPKKIAQRIAEARQNLAAESILLCEINLNNLSSFIKSNPQKKKYLHQAQLFFSKSVLPTGTERMLTAKEARYNNIATVIIDKDLQTELNKLIGIDFFPCIGATKGLQQELKERVDQIK